MVQQMSLWSLASVCVCVCVRACVRACVCVCELVPIDMLLVNRYTVNQGLECTLYKT